MLQLSRRAAWRREFCTLHSISFRLEQKRQAKSLSSILVRCSQQMRAERSNKVAKWRVKQSLCCKKSEETAAVATMDYIK